MAQNKVFYQRMQHQGDWDDTVRVVRGEVGSDSTVTTYSYDANSNIDTVWRWYAPDSAYVTAYMRDSRGLVAAIIDHEGRETAFEYDYGDITGPGYLTSKTLPGGQLTEYEADNLGQLTAIIDPLNNMTQFVYDSLGRKTQEINAAGVKTTWKYDGDDLVEMVEGITAPGTGIITKMDYDSYGRLLERRRVLKDESEVALYTATYDSAGNALTVGDESGTIAINTYDGQMRKVAFKDAMNKTERYSFDDNGNPYRKKDRNGNLTESIYNSLGQLVQKTDANNMAKPEGLRAHELFVNNYLGQMDSILVNGAVKATFGYCVCGTLDRKHYSNGVAISYERDAGRRLTGIYAVNSSNDTILSLSYTLDDAGNIIKIVRDGKTDYFSYDKNYQLVYAQYADSLTQQFIYDDAGNRIRLAETGRRNKDVSYEFNAMNQLVEATDGTQWAYDSMGNMIAQWNEGEAWEYVFSPENRLLRVMKDDSLRGEYAYDFQGRRLTSLEPGVDTLQFAWDNWNNAADYGPEESLNMRYLTGLGLDELILQRNAIGEEKWFLQDRVSSVIAMADSNGVIKGKRIYEAFGLLKDSSNIESIRFGYTAREAGLNSTYYYRMRWYNASYSAFISQDPIGHCQGIYYYDYANQNPLAYFDPLGLSPTPDSSRGTTGYTDYNFISINPVGTGTGALIGGLLTGGNPLGIGGGALVGSTGLYGGVMVGTDSSVYPYLGISLSPSVGPTIGGGLSISHQAPSAGFNIASSASAGFGGQVGYTFGKNGGGFLEAGPMTPGAAVDFFWSWKK